MNTLHKKKVLHILESNYFSGAENVVCQIINMFRDSDVDMIYCSPSGQIQEALNERNIPHVSIDNLSIKEIRRVVKEVKPDVIHAHDAKAAVLVSLSGYASKVVAQIHGNHPNMRGITPKSLSVAFFSFFWKKIIWVSNCSLEEYKYKNVVRKKSLVLPNIIRKDDISNRLSQSYPCDKAYDCIILGRINSIKNPIRAINIIKSVKKLYPDFSAVFVGNGDLLEECQSLVRRENLSDTISFLGYINNPIGVLNKSKILLMTSIYEGTPMCAIEAMALGKPIVSTPTDGIVDLVEQNVTGFYSEDDDLIAEKIIALLKDRTAYEKMVESTKNRFDMLMDESSYIESLSIVYNL